MRILVADDDPHVLQTLERILTGAGYDVTVGKDGAQALALAQADPPDLVVTDLDMPHMSGLDLLAALQADPALAQTPALVISANADPALVARATALGVAGYLVKPASTRELLDAVKFALP